MSDFAIQPERRTHRHAWQLPWQLSWPLRRSLDERLLYDIGLDPLELIEPIRQSRALPGTTRVRRR